MDGSGLLTDLYELTMAYGYWKSGLAEREAVFHLHFRQNPFHGGFSVACGLADAVAYLRGLHFAPADLVYLGGLTGRDGRALFDPAFLEYLGTLRFTGDLEAMPEGTVAFPQEPLLRVQGPLLQAQLVESALLNLINFETLIATKAARVCLAAQGQPVIEFGLRRAQGVDGALTATRAAYVGGCAGTSNVLAGQRLGIPVMGTHAHSWVMSFETERAAFRAYAEAMPNNCTFLVDTYNTLEGVRHAIEAGHWLRAQGHELAGIRLDSGDLAWLSLEARRILDAAGFPHAVIVASNDLDEHIIQSLKDQGARIDVWGVGTRLVTGHDQPALGGVYKLSAIQREDRHWTYTLKLSEQLAKSSTPGRHQVRRFRVGDEFVADGIYDLDLGAPKGFTIVDPLDSTRRKAIPAETACEDLLQPVLRRGEPVGETPSLGAIRDRTRAQLASFHAGIKRFVHPHEYPVGLELSLHELKTRMVLEQRQAACGPITQRDGAE